MSNPIRVVIVDDHEIVREGLQLFLADAGEIEVVGTAEDGSRAVELCEELAPDVILMDLVMPRVDGVEAVRQLRDAGSTCKVLILTTFINEDRVREAVEAGAVGYLLKDVGRDALLDAIRAAVRGTPTLHPEAQQHLMRRVAAPAAASPLDELTDRERDVLRLIAAGASNKAIAQDLSLSVGTVKGYVSAIFEKLDVSSRTQAALVAVEHDIDG